MSCRPSLAVLGSALLLCTGCSSDAAPANANDASMNTGGAGPDCVVDASYAVELSPSDFVATVDNPYWPLPIGASWVYGGAEYVEVSVTAQHEEILGISAVVVRDTVRDGAADADIVEDTYDWYAQDTDGNVWYLGEDTKEYEDGVVTSTAGSWRAGVGGALPGIAMFSAPKVGKPYRQEYLACEAEDFAEIQRTDATVSVPFGDYTDCVVTHEYTPLEPSVNELKTYCAGVGLVLEEDVESGDRVELTALTMP